ncbi:hypothetical protein L3Q82_000019 [Scortum barcoo]|uniref:Uncharacterized protein n=1 Tax=Scortum barcoo TaxID=214431 RepID=A0ACB8XDK9_9TELE|nr:hypothetical protein L3Q82_000019 [Scortum barcoo]
MIDFVVISSDLRPYVLDTQVKREAELDPLAKEEVGQTWQTQTYCEGLLRKSGIEGDIESEWTMFSASIIDAAVRSCGRKVSRACHGSKPRTWWWKEYFEDLLNPTDTPSTEEVEAEGL